MAPRPVQIRPRPRLRRPAPCSVDIGRSLWSPPTDVGSAFHCMFMLRVYQTLRARWFVSNREEETITPSVQLSSYGYVFWSNDDKKMVWFHGQQTSTGSSTARQRRSDDIITQYVLWGYSISLEAVILVKASCDTSALPPRVDKNPAQTSCCNPSRAEDHIDKGFFGPCPQRATFFHLTCLVGGHCTQFYVTKNKCHASRNRCLTSSNKKLLGTSALLVVTSASQTENCRSAVPQFGSLQEPPTTACPAATTTTITATTTPTQAQP